MKIATRPIYLSDQMVRAILEGKKTELRRPIKEQPEIGLAYIFGGRGAGKWSYSPYDKNYNDEEYRESERCWTPPCHADDILFVRETWKVSSDEEFIYKATNVTDNANWHSPVTMPKKAARIFLKVKCVTVERLRNIADVKKEGVNKEDEFYRYWDSTIKPKDIETYGSIANPWVWVVEFEKIKNI